MYKTMAMMLKICMLLLISGSLRKPHHSWCGRSPISLTSRISDSRRQSRTHVLDAEKLCEFRGAQKPSVSDETSASANHGPQKPLVFDGRRGLTSSRFQAAVALVFLILLTSVTSVYAFKIDVPTTLFVNENATVFLSDTGNEVYDAKLFIGDAARPSSRIFSPREGWKDARFYIAAALPSQTEFVILPLQAAESAQLCARLRKPSSSSYRQECMSVRIENRTQISPALLPTAQPAAQPTQELAPAPILLASPHSSSQTFFSSRAARLEQGIIVATVLIILIGILLLFLKQNFKSSPPR